MFYADWGPSVQDVASLLRARTKDTNGVELGTFTLDTRPTNAQVETQIMLAMGDIASIIDLADVPELLQHAARSLATIGSAMLVELSFYPEQINTNRSPYTELRDLYNIRLEQFKKSIAAAASADDDVFADGAAISPTFNFPCTQPIDWNTPL